MKPVKTNHSGLVTADGKYSAELFAVGGSGSFRAVHRAPPTSAGLRAYPENSFEEVTVTARRVESLASADSASVGTVLAVQLENRPILRTGKSWRLLPGLIVTQHSGDGKANPYFLRGFNLDHGTDFASRVDGLPVNMPTHAHIVDADFAWSHSRFTDDDPVGDHIPNALDRVASVGIAINRPSGWSGGARLRYLGPGALIEDNSVRSSSNDAAEPGSGLSVHIQRQKLHSRC